MATIDLVFHLTIKDGLLETQTITIPAEANPEKVVMQALTQYSSVGMLKREGDKFTLLSASQIEKVEVELPKLVVASPGEVAQINRPSILG